MARQHILVATSNSGKLRDLAGAASHYGIEVAQIPNFDSLPPVIEDGQTFEANACKKAEQYSRYVPAEVVIADDSGLEVDALGGEPGLYTARFGGPGLDDRDRWQLLLERLRGVPPFRRTARFRCVIALAGGALGEKVVEGVAEGVIAEAPRGEGGFGYDPVFFYPPLGRTFGELSDEDKARVSHRGLALAAARRLLGGQSVS